MTNRRVKVGDWTNHGEVLFIDNVSETVPDPICKVSSTNLCSHRLTELHLVDKPVEPEPEPELPDLPETLTRDQYMKLLYGVSEQVRKHGYGPCSTVVHFVKTWLGEKFNVK